MSKINILFLFISVLLFSSCEEEYQFSFKSPKKLSIEKPLSILVKEKNDQIIDEITYAIDGKRIENPLNIDISAMRLGKHALTAEVTYAGKTKKLTNSITFLADKVYDVYDYRVINTYPHDAHAYTQGLEFHNGFLYESTGHHGRSSLRKVALETGKVIQQIDVPKEYFAEGMTVYKDKIYQLTWQNKKGFIYDFEDFTQIGTFDYGQSLEGWGLTFDGKNILKSDGTERIWRLDPVTMKEKSYIEVYTNKQALKELNELEYINGKIYANVWLKNVITIINPKNGAVEGVADMNSLVKRMLNAQHLKHDDVLNGIAYDKATNRLFVTGKNWNTLFEIELVKKK